MVKLSIPTVPLWLETGAPRCLFCLSVSLSLWEVGGSWCHISPRVSFICHTVPITGVSISQMGPSSRNLQLDVMSLRGHRAETSKVERKINLIHPKRVESCMICRNLCTTINLPPSLRWLSPGTGERPGRKPAPLPLSDTRPDDVSSLTRYKEPERAVLLWEGPWLPLWCFLSSS